MSAARVVARYAQGRDEDQVDITITQKDGSERTIQVKPFSKAEVLNEWHV